MVTFNNLSLITILIIFLSSISSPIPMVSASRCNSEDRKVLLAIKTQLGNPPELSSWKKGSTACCDWKEVECYPKSNRVRTLTLRNLNIRGTIPPSVGDLLELESLVMSQLPRLVGNIPYSITKLKKLSFLDLSRNSLSGPIPYYLYQLTTLTSLDLSFNKFSGYIPTSIPKLNKLDVLHLDHNQLVGDIPDFTGFGKGNIYLSSNKLSGPIPRSLGRLGWNVLDLSDNMLTGDASFLFGQLKQATGIYLQRNLLSFNLTPIKFPVMLTKLELNNNMIYGSIPAQINDVRALKVFNVSYNSLCGRIPAGIVTAKFGATSYVHNKCLCGGPLPACKYSK